MPTKSFDTFDMYNTHYEVMEVVADGPVTCQHSIVAIAHNIHDVLRYISEMHAPASVRVLAVVLAGEGQDVHVVES